MENATMVSSIVIISLHASPIPRIRDNKMPAGWPIEIRRYDLRIAAGWGKVELSRCPLMDAIVVRRC